jgi:cytoskeletal protein CcmA (bactofilin family)
MFNKPNTQDGSTGSQGSSPFSSQSSSSSSNSDEGSFNYSQTSSGFRSSGSEPQQHKTSTIAEEVVLTGNIKTPGALQIEGTVKGDLEVSALTIGPTGVFEGSVTCRNLSIRGRFNGTSVCRELLVASSAQVDAKITYQDLTLQRGAVLRGELHVANFAE